jgi:hypothetical protein
MAEATLVRCDNCGAVTPKPGFGERNGWIHVIFRAERFQTFDFCTIGCLSLHFAARPAQVVLNA